MISRIFDAFVQESPVSVMMRGLLEVVFRPQRLDEIFKSYSQVQYTRELLFSTLGNLLISLLLL
jgi:tRNA1(Val) A37 N6-methylase TrmN6